MSAEPKKGGRPKLYAARVRSVQVSLDEDTIRRGRELGAGNLSVGIRKALEPSRPILVRVEKTPE